jgi:hypothetical protein
MVATECESVVIESAATTGEFGGPATGAVSEFDLDPPQPPSSKAKQKIENNCQ